MEGAGRYNHGEEALPSWSKREQAPVQESHVFSWIYAQDRGRTLRQRLQGGSQHEMSFNTAHLETSYFLNVFPIANTPHFKYKYLEET